MYSFTTINRYKKTAVNLHDLQLSNGFFDMTPKHKCQKKKIDKLDFTKIKNSLKRFKSRLELVEERISELEYRQIEVMQSEKQRKQNEEK